MIPLCWQASILIYIMEVDLHTYYTPRFNEVDSSTSGHFY